ncbi:hypothetical protein VIGAN_03132000 [Vigna angularis var. angularis]|uniref:Uncharacterized protein n=1 Tax=Vigna angularis var. angularis TaxID=157739 RepID=A0A0S3RLR5_PHAAN|nr:hypothetical protein VIGAN_03132000 [Vigna angularis var. angularis]
MMILIVLYKLLITFLEFQLDRGSPLLICLLMISLLFLLLTFPIVLLIHYIHIYHIPIVLTLTLPFTCLYLPLSSPLPLRKLVSMIIGSRPCLQKYKLYREITPGHCFFLNLI